MQWIAYWAENEAPPTKEEIIDRVKGIIETGPKKGFLDSATAGRADIKYERNIFTDIQKNKFSIQCNLFKRKYYIYIYVDYWTLFLFKRQVTRTI